MSWHIPEPMVDLLAQLDDLVNPEHVRATLFVTEMRSPMLAAAAQYHELADLHKDGATLWLNVQKLTKPEIFAELFQRTSLGDEKAMAKILGYTRAKDELKGFMRIIQVLRHIDDQGNVAVVWEQGVDQTCYEETLARAETFGGAIDIVHPCDALIRRLKLLKSEGIV